MPSLDSLMPKNMRLTETCCNNKRNSKNNNSDGLLISRRANGGKNRIGGIAQRHLSTYLAARV